MPSSLHKVNGLYVSQKGFGLNFSSDRMNAMASRYDVIMYVVAMVYNHTVLEKILIKREHIEI